ncbi:MAG: DNA-binding protein [Candidatus Bathyarchaeia archaeon]
MSEELDSEELELIRRKKMAELQRALIEEQRRAQIEQQLEVQKQAILRRILTSEARQRLANIRMVKPEFAEQLELQLIQLAQTGRIKLPITDEQLKETLIRLQSQKRDIKIRRV